jgi:hypothetical protein
MIALINFIMFDWAFICKDLYLYINCFSNKRSKLGWLKVLLQLLLWSLLVQINYGSWQMHGHVLEVVKSRVELVNNIINRVMMHVGKYIYNGRRITHARNNRIIPLCFILLVNNTQNGYFHSILLDQKTQS